MKKLFIGFVFGICVCAAFSFSKSAYEVKDVTAEVNKVSNLVIFTESKPVKDYEKLGTVNLSFFSFKNGAKYSVILPRLIDLAKEKYPNANGLIYNIADESAEVIMMK